MTCLLPRLRALEILSKGAASVAQLGTVIDSH